MTHDAERYTGSMMIRAALALLLVAASPASVSRAPYGTLSDGRAVERITLTNARGTRVGVLTLGGAIDEIRVRDRDGRFASVALSLKDVAAHEARANFGTLLGRYAGRISGGGFSLDGQRYPLAPEAGTVVSHGGRPGFGARVWQAEPCGTSRCSAVTLRYRSPDGENGFPGALDVAVTFTLTPDDALRLDYVATTSAPTVVNLSHHAYFNLAGSGNVTAQYIRVPAARVLEVDGRRVPTGKLLPVAGTALDLRHPARLGETITATLRGIDDFFLIDRGHPGLALAACSWDPASGRMLEVRTTEPGVQVFTGNSFNGALTDTADRPIQRYAAYAIEAQHAPDAPNQPGFASTVLRPGQIYRATTVYRFRTAPSLAAFDRRCR